jgi:arabinofuranosyltransferase
MGATSSYFRNVRAGWLWACVAGFLALCWAMRRFVTDDAWISARYAANLATGKGFVWNPGGPRTEGFSNPFFVAVEAVAHVLGIAPIDAARALGIAGGVALLVVVHRLAPAAVGVLATRIALVGTALYPPIALWAVGGLETVPVALALTTGVLLLVRNGERDALRAGAAFALLPWLRPEGLIAALAVVAAAEALPMARRASRRAAVRRVALAGGLPLASQALLECLRLLVYGHLVPNSVLYKAGSGDGFAVLDKFTEQARPVLLLAAVGILAARKRQRLLAVPPAVYLIGSAGMLDSVNAFSRLLLPVWPQLALLAALGIVAVTRHAGRLAAPAAAAAAALAALVLFMPEADAGSVSKFSARYAACKEEARTEAATWLRDHTPRHAVYSISDAGMVPALGDRVVVDQLLLNDPLIQQTGPLTGPALADHVFARRPDDLVLVSRDRYTFEPAAYDRDAAIAADPRFSRYALADVASGESSRCRYHLFVFRRKPPVMSTLHHASFR